jgi:hypothetical protein
MCSRYCLVWATNLKLAALVAGFPDIFGIQILTFLKHQVFIPTEKLKFVSVVLVEKLLLLAAALLPYCRNLFQIMIPT